MPVALLVLPHQTRCATITGDLETSPFTMYLHRHLGYHLWVVHPLVVIHGTGIFHLKHDLGLAKDPTVLWSLLENYPRLSKGHNYEATR